MVGEAFRSLLSCICMRGAHICDFFFVFLHFSVHGSTQTTTLTTTFTLLCIIGGGRMDGYT